MTSQPVVKSSPSQRESQLEPLNHPVDENGPNFQRSRSKTLDPNEAKKLAEFYSSTELSSTPSRRTSASQIEAIAQLESKAKERDHEIRCLHDMVVRQQEEISSSKDEINLLHKKIEKLQTSLSAFQEMGLTIAAVGRQVADLADALFPKEQKSGRS